MTIALCFPVQNIDTLERLAGVPDEALVEAHGSFARARCTSPGCGKDYSAEEVGSCIASHIPWRKCVQLNL